MSKYDDQLDTINPKKNDSGVRLDVRLYVYSDGHGSFVVDGINLPARNQDVAADIFQDLWRKATDSAGQDRAVENGKRDGTRRAAVRQWLRRLGIEEIEPIGALKLQELMRSSKLKGNEFSRSLVEARDE